MTDTLDDVPAWDAFDEDVSFDDYAFECATLPVADRLHLLKELQPDRLSAAGRVDALVALRRFQRWAAAQEQRLVAAHVAKAAEVADQADKTRKQWVREDVACALDIDPDHARSVIVKAEALVQQFPATLALVEEGELSPRHAAALVDATLQLDEKTAAKVERRVIERSVQQSLSNFKRSLKRAVHAIDPRTAEQKHEADRAERVFWNMRQPNGMAQIGARVPAEDAALIESAVNAYADRVRATHPDDPRTKAQLRADALTEFALNYLNSPASGGKRGRRPSISITVSLETLLGLNEQPAELDGYGPITAAVARKLAADPTSTWWRLITDKPGRLLDYQQTKYKPPKQLDQHVRARDRRCRFPKCKRRAKRCDIDHRHDWQDGGSTCAINLECLCERHHALKHESGWRLDGNPEQTLTWTTPTGHTYQSDPPAQPTAMPPEPDDEPAPF